MRFFDKRDRPVKVHTGKAVAQQLAAARHAPRGTSPSQLRHGAFLSNLGDGFFIRGGLTLYSDGGPGAGSKTRQSKSGKRRARRRDLARRRRTPGGAFIPTSTA